MPVIDIGAREPWYPRDLEGDPLNRTGPFTFEESTTLILGNNLPDYLLVVMKEHWPEANRAEIAVDYRKLHQQGSTADIWVTLRVGSKWARHHEYMVDALVLAVNELILMRPGPPKLPRPSFDIEVVLTDWHGATVAQTGQVMNTW